MTSLKSSGSMPGSPQDAPGSPSSDQAGKNLLRVVICGNTGDGKSALIEEFLRNCQVSDSESDADSNISFHEFASAKRNYLVADTQGHDHYVRKLATGPLACDFAILLADARKGFGTNTRHHCCILNLLGIRKIVLAVNKMDLVDFNQDRFEEIASEFASFAESLGFEDVVSIPVSALSGANIIELSADMGLYHGPTLMAHLDMVDVTSGSLASAFRMPVQDVSRSGDDVQEIAGIITGGIVRPGDEIMALPAGRQTKIERIISKDDEIDAASISDDVSLTLSGQVDLSPGDVLCALGAEADISDQVAANLIWMDETPMLPGRRYFLQCGNQNVTATISTLKHKLNVSNLEHQAGTTLERDQIGYCNLSLSKPIGFDPFAQNRDMGTFFLIDRRTKATVGVGMIAFGLRRATNIQWQKLEINKSVRAALNNQKPCALWFTGLSGSGKSTIASLLEKQLHARGRHTYVLDGDNVRHGLNKDLGFTDADRVENIRRISETARLFVDAGLIVLVSFISPFRSERRMARDLFEKHEFLEVYVDTPIEVCEQRDPKGLYKKARAGEIKNFTGIDSAYEEPEWADIHLKASEHTADELVANLIVDLEAKGFI